MTETSWLRAREMDGPIARWYARQRGSRNQLAEYREQAARLTAGLPDGAQVLEVAPGPGYLAVEMARSGRLSVTGLDLGRSFVRIAGDLARREGVRVDFRHGDVTAMPFDAQTFDLIVCQAAFKNFQHPLAALDEMHRVLRPGGTAVVDDMDGGATLADIDRNVRAMGLRRRDAFFTKWTLAVLRRRAYPVARFERLAARSAFGTVHPTSQDLGFEARLTRQP